MAYSYIKVTAAAGQTSVPFNFDYLATSEIKVKVNDVETTTWSLSSPNVVALDTAMTGGEIIEIERVTDLTTRAVDFASGAVLTEEDLDLSAQQVFNAAQEALDSTEKNLSETFNGQYDAKNKRIVNIADGVDPQDAITKSQLEYEYPAVLNVSNNMTDVNTVSNNITDVNEVQDNITDVNTVASNIASVNTVADNIDDVITVANDLNEAVSELETVANDLNEATSEIEVVANNITDVNIVGTNITNVNKVATIDANVTTVSGISTDVTAVANNQSNINNVASNESNVNTVAGISTDVTTVADNVTDVTNFANVYQGGKASDPNLRNDSTSLQAGDLYFNTTVNELRTYSGSQWVSGTAGTMAVQRFTGDGNTTVFTLSTAPSGENNTQVYVNGIYQQKDTYSVSGTTLTLTEAPQSDEEVEVVTISTLALGETDASLVSYTDVVSQQTTVQNQLSITERKLLAYPTKYQMTQADVPSGSFVQTTGYWAEGDGGAALYKVVSSYANTIDSRHAFTMSNGNVAVLVPVGGIVNIKQVGSTGDESENITTALLAALRTPCHTIKVDQKKVSLTGNIDLNGTTLEGNHTVFSGAFITNGTLVRITKHGAILGGGTPWEYDVGRAQEKILVKRTATDNSVTSPYGEVYSIISPTSSGKIARFDLVNGVGASGSSDAGGNHDRLRVVNSYLHSYGYAIKNVPDSTTGNVTVTSLELKNYLDIGTTLWSPNGNATTFARNVSVGASATYIVNGNISRKSNMAFLTSGGSTDSIEITINGVVVPSIAPKELSGGNELRIVSFNIDLKDSTNEIKITNTGPSGFCYVFGVNLFEVGDLPVSRTAEANYYDQIILGGSNEVLYSGTGASIDTVLRDGSGTFCGSYHGGDDASEIIIALGTPHGLRKVRVASSGTTSSEALSVGDIVTCKNINIRYQGTIQASTPVDIWVNYDFGLDGAVDVRGYYLASNNDVVINTLYTGMHSTSRNLYLSNALQFNSANPTNSFYSVGREFSPYIQVGSSNQQIAIIPQWFDEGISQRNQQVWDTSAYIKYYYCPIQGVDTVLPQGERIPFACKYVYGATLF